MNEPTESGLESAVRPRVGLVGSLKRPAAILWIVLGVALVIAAANLPSRWSEFERILPVVQQWGNPEEQYRMETIDLPYPHDLLRQADAIIPRHASVLLVTPGTDVERVEYITFNRALYLLAPRSVWWASPGASDGSWKSRWRITSALTTEAIGAVARDTHAQYILAYNISAGVNLAIGRKVAEWPDGYLLMLDDTATEAAGAHQQSAGPLWPLQLLAALAVILAVGWLALQAVMELDKSLRPGKLEIVALAWPLGAGLTSVLMLWLSWTGVHLGWQLLAITVGTLVLVGVTLRRKRENQYRAPSTEYQVEGKPEALASSYLVLATRFLLALLLTVQVLIVAVSAVGRPLTVWDSWANWAIKARIIFLDSFVSPAVYTDQSRAITQLDYPLMQPLVESWLFKWLGAPDDRFAGIASLLFFVSLLALSYYAVRHLGGSVTLGLAVCTVVATIWEIGTLASIVFTEMPLLVFAGIAALYIYRWLREGSPGTLLIASMAAGLMPWTKREGIVLLVAMCVGLLATQSRSPEGRRQKAEGSGASPAFCILLSASWATAARRAWIGVVGLALGALVLAGPWWAFMGLHGVVNPAFSPITPGTLSQNIDRWPNIAGMEINSLLSPVFSYVWPLALIAGAALWFADRKSKGVRLAAFLPVTALLYVLLTGFVYIFSDFVPYEQHVLSSIDRLLAEVVPLLVLWLVLLAHPPTEGVMSYELPGNAITHNS